MWVHTCSLDHKHALQNYKSKGFEIFKEEEIDFVAQFISGTLKVPFLKTSFLATMLREKFILLLY